MSNPIPSKLGPPRWPGARAGIQQSASFSAHLKSLERTIPLRAMRISLAASGAPVKGGYFDNVSPTTGQYCKSRVPRQRHRARSRCCTRCC